MGRDQIHGYPRIWTRSETLQEPKSTDDGISILSKGNQVPYLDWQRVQIPEPSALLRGLVLLVLRTLFHAPSPVDQETSPEKEEPIINADLMSGGFEYSDAILVDNDARFVFGFVRQAITNGCIAANYVESLGANRAEGGLWHVECRNVRSGETFTIKCRTLVNAQPFRRRAQ